MPDMRAILYERRGIDNLELREVPEPRVGDNEVKLRVLKASINPVDLMSVEVLSVSPIPHIPGSEFFGVVEEVGKGVTHVSPGDRVAVYTRLFDGSCESCLRGRQTYCVNGKRIGVETQGGYAEEIVVPARNVMRSSLRDEILASLPIAILTPYHALKLAQVNPQDLVVVLGASGNTGMFLIQLAKIMGATVVAVSTKAWVKDFNPDIVVDYVNAEEVIKEFTQGKMASVVVNSLGQEYWDLAFKLVGNYGRIITYGAITGGKAQLDVNKLYLKHVTLLGTNRGDMGDFIELLTLASKLKVRTWRTFRLEDIKEAFLSFKEGRRDGRIFLSP
ncbi:MAG: alcohol dehydrogenase catalytic domain-containing protein [Metallosphaera sp.]